MCSVDASAVRPFWLRACVFLVSGLAGLYLALCLLAFGFLKQRGYQISFPDVALPGRWKRFPEFQSRLFFDKGRDAYAAGRLNEAVLALSFAYEREPRNYEAGALLAWIWQTSQPTLSNRIYQQLLREHPERRAETAQRWYRILLNRGDFDSIGRLAIEQLKTREAADIPWTFALLFADRHSPAVAPRIAAALEQENQFSPDVRSTLQWEERLHAADPEDAKAALMEAGRDIPSTPLGLYHRIDSLVRLGRTGDALRVLNLHGAGLDDRTRATLKLAALGAAHDRDGRRSEIDALLQPAPTTAVVEFVTANLIRYPDEDLIHNYLSTLAQRPLPPVAENFGAYAGLFCLAALSRDSAHSQSFAEALRHLSASPLSFLENVEQFFHGESEDRRLSTYLPRLQPLPLEIVFALYDRIAADQKQTMAPRP